MCLLIAPVLASSATTPAASAAGSSDSESGSRVRYKHGPAYIYRVTLTDKQGTTGSLEHPTRFLSRRSVERRNRQGLPLDSTDLPVSARYVRLIERGDITVIGQSRWQNTLLVRVTDSTLIHRVAQLPCVKDTRLVWLAPDSITPTAVRGKYHDQFEDRHRDASDIYGQAARQTDVLQGRRLHDLGLRGEAMMIAVIDGGFKNVDRIPAFQRVDIRGCRDFVYNPEAPASAAFTTTPGASAAGSSTIFAETDHGTKVLSAMALNVPYFYVGTAPKASYWLLRSEDLQSEQEVEEDYWTMAAEFADSVGCDLVNSSLGYNEYDHPFMSYRQWQLDGRTAFVSRSAAMMARKGIILINSAGNSGMGTWKKIGVPADADHILTVGAILADDDTTPAASAAGYKVAPFSSVGPSQDGRVKPDVIAIGAPARLVNGRGVIMDDMGTSFSAPIVCGFAACLWQALRNKTAEEVIDLIRQSASNYAHPDNIYGYGVPDFWQAYLSANR